MTPTVENCRALLKEMPLESCRATAAWRSRGCPDDAVIIQPRGRGSTCYASGGSGGKLGVAKEGRRKEEIGDKIGSGLPVSPLELTLKLVSKLRPDVGEWNRYDLPKVMELVFLSVLMCKYSYALGDARTCLPFTYLGRGS